MAVDLKDLTMDDVLKALPLIIKDDFEGEFIYNLEMNEPDGVRVKNEKYWVKLMPGNVEYGEGHSDDPEASTLTVNMGGLDTVLAFQVYGLEAATASMIMGYIFTDNIKKAESWFKVLKIGLEPIKEAMPARAWSSVTRTWISSTSSECPRPPSSPVLPTPALPGSSSTAPTSPIRTASSASINAGRTSRSASTSASSWPMASTPPRTPSRRRPAIACAIDPDCGSSSAASAWGTPWPRRCG